MKRIRSYALFLAIVLSAMVISGFGWYVKTYIFTPLDLHTDADPISCAFLFPETARLMDLDLRPAEPTEETEPPTTAWSPPTWKGKRMPREMLVEDPPETPTMPPPEPPVYGEDETYFDDALFIGDSRTVGLRDMARLGNADYFCKVGMNVYSMFREGTSDKYFSYCRLERLLTEKTYSKIYIGLGINEAGYSINSLRNKFGDALTRIQALQPDAIIIIHSVMTVSRGKAASSYAFRIERLADINAMLQEFVDDKKVFYIDVNEVLADEEGYLPSGYSADGCHLYGRYYDEWAKFICDNAILQWVDGSWRYQDK